jgi:hypothetical protein
MMGAEKIRGGIALFLVLIFLVTLPIAFASRLPVVCKPFHPEKNGKAGPCNFKSLVSPGSTIEAGIAYSSPVYDGTVTLTTLPEVPFRFSSLSISGFLPLRC